MKKTMIAIALVIMAISAQAQDNVVKLGVGGLWYGGINLEYERVLTEKTSVLAEFGFSIPSNFSEERLNSYANTLGIQDAESSIDLQTAQFNSFYLVAEYRYYFGDEVLRGFYVAPYLKYSRFSADIEGTYDNNNLIDIDSDIETSLSSVAVGAGFGYQWIVNDQVTINWNVFGLGVGINTLNASFTSTDNNNVFAEWEEDVVEFMEGIPFVGNNFDSDSDNASRTITGSASYPSIPFRLGLSVGYMF